MIRVNVFLAVLLTACTASTPPQQPADARSTPAPPEGIVLPKVLIRVEPEYPEDLRNRGVQGEVVVGGTVPKEGGRLRDAHVVGGHADARLRQYALDAASQWTFAPARTIEGEPVDFYYEVTMRFRVN